MLGSYHSNPSWATTGGFESFREEWLGTPQPETFLLDLSESMEDDRTIAEVWEENDRAIGFLWVTFIGIEGYRTTVAEVRDIQVHPDFQRRGIGSRMLEHAERVARERGADRLRSEAGTGNIRSRGLHEKQGFQSTWIQYEKVLAGGPGAQRDIGGNGPHIPGHDAS